MGTADLNLTKSGAAQPTRLSYHIDDGIDKVGLQEAGHLKIFQSKVLQNSLIQKKIKNQRFKLVERLERAGSQDNEDDHIHGKEEERAFSVLVYKFLESPVGYALIMTTITAGAVSGMLHYVHDVDNQTERHIEVFEFALSIVFVAELTIRMRGYVVMHGMVSILWKAETYDHIPAFFHDRMNCLDAVVVFIDIIIRVLLYMTFLPGEAGSSISKLVKSLRLLRLMRLFRLVRAKRWCVFSD